MADTYLIPKKLARKSPRLVQWVQWFETKFFAGLFWVLHRASLESGSKIAGALFGVVGPLSRKSDRPRNNLAIAFPTSTPQWREQTTRGIFRHVGVATVELAKLDQIWEQREQRIEFVIEPAAREHLAAKRATVFVCAHIGPWQVTNLIAKHCDLTLSTVYAAESSPAMESLLSKQRQSFGAQLIPSSAGVRPLLKELAADHCIGLAIDSRLDSGKMIPFFGVDAATNTSAAGLALRTGAALIPIRAQRLPQGRFRVTVYDPVVSQNVDAPESEKRIELTTLINRHFESWIRENPEQWICLKRRWPRSEHPK
ncbi:MAG: lysophospholipid acyltransferase family protein [Halioglobus sp.]